MEDSKSESVVIRKATYEDSAAILGLVKEHLTASVYSWLPVDDQKILDTIKWMVTADPHQAYPIVAYDGSSLIGLLGCVSLPLSFTNTRVSGEMLWLVREDYRGTTLGARLLKLLEEWSQRTQHVAVQVGSNDKRTSALLEKFGYREKARTYIKDINGR